MDLNWGIAALSLLVALSVGGCAPGDVSVGDGAAGEGAGAENSSDVPLQSAGDGGSIKAKPPSDVQPTFDCSKALGSSIEQLICSDEELALLDRQMAEIYRAAGKTEKAAQDKYFKARQRGWIKGRNDCWKVDDKRACTRDSYLRRIAELQARYALVEGKHVTYACADGDVTVTFYDTAPATAVARFKGEESFMNVQPSASGARYQGRNESLWEHQGEATIQWGYDAPEMRCPLKP